MRAFLRLALACSFALSTACGSIANKADAGNGGGDASSGDGGGNVADAAPDAATFGMVTVNVFVGGNPAPNMAVMYHKADGSYIGSTLTDSNGQVIIADMPVGGAVTAPVSPYGIASDQPREVPDQRHQRADRRRHHHRPLRRSRPATRSAGTMSVTMPGTRLPAPRTMPVTVGCTTSTTGTAERVTEAGYPGQLPARLQRHRRRRLRTGWLREPHRLFCRRRCSLCPAPRPT